MKILNQISLLYAFNLKRRQNSDKRSTSFSVIAHLRFKCGIRFSFLLIYIFAGNRKRIKFDRRLFSHLCLHEFDHISNFFSLFQGNIFFYSRHRYILQLFKRKVSNYVIAIIRYWIIMLGEFGTVFFSHIYTYFIFKRVAKSKQRMKFTTRILNYQ